MNSKVLVHSTTQQREQQQYQLPALEIGLEIYDDLMATLLSQLTLLILSVACCSS